MTKEEAEKKIQSLLAEMQATFDTVIRPLADEHQVEFSWMGCTMHYRDYYDYGATPRKHLAKTGFFVADSEWQGSGLGCSYDGDFYAWRRANWPEDYDDED